MSQAGSISGGGGGGGLFSITGNSGGAVFPLLNNINIVGAGALSIAGNPGTATLTVSYGGSGGTNTFHTDSGDAVEAGNAITIAGGSNINTVGAGSTVTVNLDNNVTISGTYTSTAGNLKLPFTANDGASSGSIYFGNLRFISFDADFNTYIGYNTGTYPHTGAADNNIVVGHNCMTQVVGPFVYDNVVLGSSSFNGVADNASGNLAIGTNSMTQFRTGDGNIAIGASSFGGTGGSRNVAIGHVSLGNFFLTGDHNIGIGVNSGINLTTTDSNNICIAHDGIAGDNGVIRIGTDLTHVSTFIAGAYGVTPAMSPQMMTIGSDGEIGSQAISGSAVWIEETGTSASMDVNTGYIANNGALVTLTLPATAVIGDIIEVAGKGAGGWSIAQNSGQTIHFGASSTTTGVAGSLSSTLQYDTVRMVCITADTDFVVLSSVGNLTVA